MPCSRVPADAPMPSRYTHTRTVQPHSWETHRCTHSHPGRALPCFPTLQTVLGSKRGKQRGVYQMQGGSGGGRGLGWYRGVTLGRRCHDTQQRRGSNEIARARRGGRDRLNHTNTSTKTIGHSFSHRLGGWRRGCEGAPQQAKHGAQPRLESCGAAAAGNAAEQQVVRLTAALHANACCLCGAVGDGDRGLVGLQVLLSLRLHQQRLQGTRGRAAGAG